MTTLTPDERKLMTEIILNYIDDQGDLDGTGIDNMKDFCEWSDKLNDYRSLLNKVVYGESERTCVESATQKPEEITFTLKDGREVCAIKLEDVTDTMAMYVMKDIYWYHSMNSENTNHGGYTQSDMRKYLQEEVLSKFPDDMVEKMGTFDGDKLRLLSKKEVFGDKQCPAFKDQRMRIALDKDGHGKCYWLQDVIHNSASNFAYVYNNGLAGSSGASYTSIGVRPVFLI